MLELAGDTGARFVGSGYSYPPPEPRRPPAEAVIRCCERSGRANQFDWGHEELRAGGSAAGETGTVATYLVVWVRGRATSIIIHRTRCLVGEGRIRELIALRIVGVLIGWHRTERLAMRPVDDRRSLLRVDGPAATLRGQSAGVAEVWIGGVRGHKGLRLRGDGREDAFLLETLAVGAAPVLGGFEAGTTDLASSAFRARQARGMTRGELLCAACNTDTRSPSAVSEPAG